LNHTCFTHLTCSQITVTPICQVFPCLYLFSSISILYIFLYLLWIVQLGFLYVPITHRMNAGEPQNRAECGIKLSC
jgi:hypothetical protein